MLQDAGYSQICYGELMPPAKAGALYTLPRGLPLVRVIRGERTESVHSIAACICNADGRVLRAYGTTDMPIWLRSVAKPFIAAAVVRKGLVEKFGFEAHEIAVIAGSHSAENFHISAVRSILQKIGLDEDFLKCGPQRPEYEESLNHFPIVDASARRVYNNCSGKHAGMLALCRAMGTDLETYFRPDNAAVQYIFRFCGDIFCEDPAALPLATDGCGIPTFATSLRRTAQAFAKLATLRNVSEENAAALKKVRDAMAAQPQYVRGTGLFDTELISATNGHVIGKLGAEGVHGDAFIDSGLGLAVKVVDGNSRALPPVVLQHAREAGAINNQTEAILSSFVSPTIRNSNGNTVGRIQVCE